MIMLHKPGFYALFVERVIATSVLGDTYRLAWFKAFKAYRTFLLLNRSEGKDLAKWKKEGC